MINLYVADVILGLSQLEPESIDVVATSPEYNLKKPYKNSKDDRPVAEYLEWTLRWALEVRRALKPNGSFFLNIAGTPSRPYLPLLVVQELRREFVLQNTIHWIKSITVHPRGGDPINVGHFKPLSSNRYLNDCHEYIFHFTKSGNVPLHRKAIGVPYTDKSNVSRWGHTDGADLRCRGNTWYIPYETIQNRRKQRDHPATFPIALPEQCFRLHGGARVHELVGCDPFVGIGSSALAASRLQLTDFHGIDNCDDYISQAVDKLRAERSPIGEETWLKVHRS